MKRFYEEATVHEDGGEWGVKLDGKPLRTPAKAPLVLPTRALAEAIADEWRGQEVTIKPATLPLTRIASTAIDLIPQKRPAVIEETAKYAGTDLLCYHAEEPAKLVQRQAEAWQPMLDWAMLRYDAPLKVTAGILPVSQPAQSLRALTAALAAMDDQRLMVLHLVTGACGSLILALALAEGRIGADEAFALAQLDETFEIELWGEDAEQTARRANLLEDIRLMARFLSLLKPRA